MEASRNLEIEKNYRFFLGYVGSILPDHRGKYALLRHQQVVRVYDALLDAVLAGHSQFGDGMFSVQEVTDTPLDLGFFSHASFEG
jgi:hypothetical protein